MPTSEHIHEVGNILCCLCGTEMKPNAANMCPTCLKSQVDLSNGIPKQTTVAFCRHCGRYNRPPWQHMELESAELLGLCLKRIKGLNKVRIVDAGFLWTEPHSRRLKVKITVQKEAEEIGGVIVEQGLVVEVVVQPQQCEDCARSYTEHTWKACVQVRQKVNHKRTFLLLEQLLLKHNMTASVINVQDIPGGLDLFFATRSHANQLVDFVQSVVPARSNFSKRLISQDFKSNTTNYKYTFLVELVPICRYNLVCLPTKLARSAGNISPLLLCDRVRSTFRCIDFETLRSIEVSANQFWRHEFRAIMTSTQFVEFVIIDVEKTGETQGKLALAEVTCARSSDFGVNDTQYVVMSHLGNLLSPGDTAAGFDLSSAVFNDDDMKPMKNKSLPEIILVKKTFPDAKKKRRKKRRFQLKSIEKSVVETSKPRGKDDQEMDEEIFMQELEEDPELRARINLYARDNEPTPSEAMTDADDVEFPQVDLHELINEMDLGTDQTPSAAPVGIVSSTDSMYEVGQKRRFDSKAL